MTGRTTVCDNFPFAFLIWILVSGFFFTFLPAFLLTSTRVGLSEALFVFCGLSVEQYHGAVIKCYRRSLKASYL